MLYHYGVFVCV